MVLIPFPQPIIVNPFSLSFLFKMEICCRKVLFQHFSLFLLYHSFAVYSPAPSLHFIYFNPSFWAIPTKKNGTGFRNEKIHIRPCYADLLTLKRGDDAGVEERM
jgi:hypothetical protein